MHRSAALRVSALEDRTTPSRWIGDFVGPIQMRQDLLAHLLDRGPQSGPEVPLTNPVEPPGRAPNFLPFVGPCLPPDFDWVISNPVMPPDWHLNLEPVRTLNANPIGDPAILPPIVPLTDPVIGDPIILPPIVPLIPPYDVKPIGDPAILPPVIPLTDSIENTFILDPPYGPYYPFPPTPCADTVESAPDWCAVV